MAPRASSAAKKSAPKSESGGGRAGRPVWSGTLSFGLIAIPISLSPAVREAEGRVAFHVLDERDGARLRRRMYCPEHDKLVDDDEIVRGFEVVEGKYVTVDDEELKAAAPERSEALEIEQFVPVDSIDPLYYDRPYWVSPNSGAKKPFALLLEVLDSEGMAGIASFVMHAREHVVALRAVRGRLCLLTLRYAAEVRQPEGIAPESKPDAAAVQAMRAVLKKLEGKLDPKELDDPRDEEVRAAVKQMAGAQSSAKPAGKKTAAKSTAKSTSSKSSGARSTAKKPAARSSSKSAAAKSREKLKVVGGSDDG